MAAGFMSGEEVLVVIIGDIQAGDEYAHQPGPESNFSESMYFNFFDRAHQTGGFVRIGNRVNEGSAEVTVLLFLPAGEALFNFKRPEITTNDRFDSGGMRFDVLEPLVQHRTVYEGSAVYLKDPTQLAEPRQAFKQNPHKQIKLDLVHEAVGPLYGSTGTDHKVEEFDAGAPAHYEQHMMVHGTLTIEDDTIQIDALGVRDHSWGPRTWQAIRRSRWITCNFSPDFALMASEILGEDGTRKQTGVVVRDQTLENIKSVDIVAQFAANNLYHQRFTATLGLESGEVLTVAATVKGFVPLRNRRGEMVTHIGEGMTEYRLGDQIGYGLSEFLDQVQ
jgi:hypothetical protein